MQTISIATLKQENFLYMKKCHSDIQNDYLMKKRNIEQLAFLEGLELPDGASLKTYMLCFDCYPYVSISLEGFGQLHDIRTQLRRMIADYSDKVVCISAYCTDKAFVEYQTSHPMVRVEVFANPDDIPKSMYPSEDCGFHYEESKRLVFSCNGKKAV